MPIDEDALRIANDSGFPLQIALHRQVRETTTRHGWTVRYAEHAWSNRDGSSGFIDLVLRNGTGTSFLLVECKRVRDSTWLFLPNDGEPKPRHKTKVWVSLYQSGSMPCYNWVDLPVDPSSPEAHFCAVRGQSSNDRITLLERVGAELVSATEALAAEDRDYRPDNAANVKIYLNAIVTTAELKLATFDPGRISLSDGTLAATEVESVPYVRLRKQLSTRPVAFSPTDYRNGLNIAWHKEHTVFVVRADSLPLLLTDLEVDDQALRHLAAG